MRRLAEIASTLGVGLLTRQAGRTLIKAIPGLGSGVGSVAGGALAAAPDLPSRPRQVG